MSVRERLVGVVAVVCAVASLLGCVEPRKEKPVDRIHRMRLQYRVSGVERETRRATNGTPELVMTLSVRNTGKEKLKAVTMVLRMKAPDGSLTVSRPVTLDVSAIEPGKSGEVKLVVPDLNATEYDDVSLTMEDQPTPEQRLKYPEYRGAVS